MKRPLRALVFFVATAAKCFAPPPLVTADVPTADAQAFEWYVGGRYQESESGRPSRLLPFSELVYGVTERQEVTLEFAGLSQGGDYGLTDAVIGTKYLFQLESRLRPGFAGSFELKLPTGNKNRGRSSGEFDYDIRLRAQKTWGRLTAIGNAGYTFVTTPTIGGARQSVEDVPLFSFAQEWAMTPSTRLLSEIYFVGREAPGDANRFAFNVGFKHRVRDHLTVHAAFGQSLRSHRRGGPDARVYAGLKYEFDAPWKLSRPKP
ncbi:MAG: transporter [Opitutaceae bacterium]